MTDEDYGATVRAWVDVIRRAQFDKAIPGVQKGRYIKASTVKLVTLTLASYADVNGRRVFPGIARVAADCAIGYNVAERCLAGLRDLGLIELVRRAVRRAARSERERTDEYRLTLPADLLERLTVPTPSEYLEIVARIARPHRPPSQVAVEPPDPPPSQRVSDPAAAEVSTTIADGDSPVSTTIADSDLPPSQLAAKVYTDLATSTTSHSEIALTAELTVGRVREADAEDPNFDDGGTGPPTLRVVTGRPAGVKEPPPPAFVQPSIWPAPVPALAPAVMLPDQRSPAPTPGELAVADFRRLMQGRKRGRASA